MYKVKLTIAPSEIHINRQMPQGGFVWGDYEFHINDNTSEADFWVVCYQRLPNKMEQCLVAPENTIFVTWEPDSVWHFSKGFLNQFGKVISCQQNLKHHNVVYDQPGLGWHIGMVRHNGINVYNKDYDYLSTSHPQKTKLISVISSNKAFTQGHRERIEFVKKLKQHYGDSLDVFGRGIRDFDDKWAVIAPYKYHISLENCAIPYYWSEKLADSFLGNAFPFYYGCTNVGDFFSPNSYRTIDIHNPEQAIKIIDQAIADDLADKCADAVEQSKQLVLNQYNFFSLISKHIATMNVEAPKQLVTIKDDLSFVDARKFFMMVHRTIGSFVFKMRN